MNKILVNNEENELILNGGKYEFQKDGTFTLEVESFEKDIFLVVSEKVKVVLNLLGKKTNLHIHLQIKKDATLIFNYLALEGNISLRADLVEEGATFNLNYSVLNSNNSYNQIEIRHQASKTEALLKNHGFSKNHANLILDVSAYINKEASKCISHQDNQIIENENSLSQINPNLYIDNYDVDASHSAYVGEFKENELFYLMSRGLKIEEAKLLLLQAFLMGSLHIDDERREKYQGEIKKYFIR